MTSMRPRRTIPALVAISLLALAAGCGSDSSGQTDTAGQVSITPPTSPLATTQVATSTEKAKKVAPTSTAPAAPAGCTVPDTYQDLKFTGLDCTAALGVAEAWDQNGKDCNTIDNPNSPEGYNKTCSVEGFSCTAKRDVHSDGRFVTCTQGGKSVRFTWYPV
jgi:hypothetical protein